jgi:CheY-like chemotaxis protein
MQQNGWCALRASGRSIFPRGCYGHIDIEENNMRSQPLSRILVVEDNVDSNEMLCELLRSLNHAADGVTSGEQALSLLKQRDFDIVIADISLPGISGIELARRIAREKPATKLIFASGFDMEIAKNLDFPVTVLPKPFDFIQLENILNELIRGNS